MAGRTKGSHSEEWWAKAPPYLLRCTATLKSTGLQCRRAAEDGAVVCDQHGGAAPQVRRRAAERVVMTADDAAQQLVAWMNDEKVEMRERVKIAQDMLDRAGLAGAQLVKVMPAQADPVMELFSSIAADPDGLLAPEPERLALPSSPEAQARALDDVLDAVVIEDDPEPVVLVPPAEHHADVIPLRPERQAVKTPKHIRDALRELI